MNVKELMEYPKIRELLKKYWDNDEISGKFDTDSMSALVYGFAWYGTEEGQDFWEFLNEYGPEHCKGLYPEYFVKEEETPIKGSNVDIEHLRKWPELYERAKHILSCVGGCGSLHEAAKEYWDKGYATQDGEDWEGVLSWSAAEKGGYVGPTWYISGVHGDYQHLSDFDKQGEEKPTESTTSHKKFTKEDLYQTYWEGTKEEMTKVCNVALSLGYVFYLSSEEVGFSYIRPEGSITLDLDGDILTSRLGAYIKSIEAKMDISTLDGYSQEGLWLGDMVESRYYPNDVSFTEDFMTDSLLEEERTTMTLAARIITSSTAEYCGHAQLEVTFKPSLEELTALMDELDNYYTQSDTRYSVYTTIESDGSGSIHVRNFWNKKKDSPSGKHKDKLIFSFGA